MASTDSASASKTSVLTEDWSLPPGQRFALISVVGPDQRQRTEKYGIKIRGVFNTREEAEAYVKNLIKIDPLFDVYVCDVGKWLLIPPDPSQIDDRHYSESFLEDLITGYQKNQIDAKRVFEERKAAVMRDGLDKHLLPEERIAPPTQETAMPTDLLAKMMEQDEKPKGEPAAA